jgi:F-type H+-transporting ATPase subunit epsilon
MLQCVVVTPEKTLRDEADEFVALPLYDGEIGIATGHSPMIGRLGCGELRISTDSGTERLYVEGGFVEVLGDVVSVLTNRAMPAADIDEAVARQQLNAAIARPAKGDEALEVRERAVAQARSQLRVARRLSQ